jgi:hypothetical protein
MFILGILEKKLIENLMMASLSSSVSVLCGALIARFISVRMVTFLGKAFAL